MQLFEFVFWIFVIWAVIMTATGLYEHHNQQSLDTRDYLDRLYASVWTGRAEDRLSAWYRVIEHLHNYCNDEKILLEARKCLNEERNITHDEELSSTMIVSRSGMLHARHKSNPPFRRSESYLDYLVRCANKGQEEI